jgi:hypothetical protein
MTTWRQYTVNIVALFLLGSPILGQEFWETKQYQTWSNEEIAKLTTDSPWAKELKVSSGGQNMTLRITWLTALPVKQAVLKERMDEGGILAESAKEIMGVEEQYYALGLTGLPSDLAGKLTEAALRVPNKPEIRPAKGDFQDRGRMMDVMILFSRASPIVVDDKEVEVILKLDGVEIGKKFPLNEMLFNGKLEL